VLREERDIGAGRAAITRAEARNGPPRLSFIFFWYNFSPSQSHD